MMQYQQIKIERWRQVRMLIEMGMPVIALTAVFAIVLVLSNSVAIGTIAMMFVGGVMAFVTSEIDPTR